MTNKQNFAIHIYYMFYLNRLFEYMAYKDIAFNVVNYYGNPSDYFRVVEPISIDNNLECTIKINNQSINLGARIDDYGMIPAICISMCKYCEEEWIARTDEKLDELEDRLCRWIKTWKKDHSAEFKYWKFQRPTVYTKSFTVERYIPLHALNKKTMYKSIKYIDDMLNKVVEAYINLHGGTDDVE